MIFRVAVLGLFVPHPSSDKIVLFQKLAKRKKCGTCNLTDHSLKRETLQGTVCGDLKLLLDEIWVRLGAAWENIPTGMPC